MSALIFIFKIVFLLTALLLFCVTLAWFMVYDGEKSTEEIISNDEPEFNITTPKDERLVPLQTALDRAAEKQAFNSRMMDVISSPNFSPTAAEHLATLVVRG